MLWMLGVLVRCQPGINSVREIELVKPTRFMQLINLSALVSRVDGCLGLRLTESVETALVHLCRPLVFAAVVI